MRGAALSIWLLLLAAHAEADTLVHVVVPEQTLESIARDYYGEPSLAPVLAATSGLRVADPEVGRELSLPSAVEYEVGPGETWSSLARDHWGDAELGRDLAVFLGLDASQAPPTGVVLPVPELLSWRIGSGDTLIAISSTFYRSRDRAAALARLNRIEDPRRLQAGAVLRVPFTKLARPPRETANVSAAPRAGDGELRRAVNAYLDGRFEESLDLLLALRTPLLAHGDDADRQQLFKHLIFAYVAFERDAAACSAYRALRSIEPELELDPDLVSPKILDAISTCE